MPEQAFSPGGTIKLVVTGGGHDEGVMSKGASNLRIYNAGPDLATIVWSFDPVIATGNEMPLVPDYIETFTKSNETNVSIHSDGTTKVYITTGDGV